MAAAGWVQLAWIWAPTPSPRRAWRVQIVEPKPPDPRRPPPRWGDCQEAEAKRVRLVIASGAAAREDVPPEPCARTLCVHNLLTDFPKATGELCVLRLATQKRSTHEIGARIGMSHTAVVKMEAEALGSARKEPRFRALMDEIGDDRAAKTSIEERIRRALARLGPSTWPMVALELGIDDGVRRIGVRSEGDVYRAHVRQVIYRMARRRDVRLTEANGEDWFSVEEDE